MLARPTHLTATADLVGPETRDASLCLNVETFYNRSVWQLIRMIDNGLLPQETKTQAVIRRSEFEILNDTSGLANLGADVFSPKHEGGSTCQEAVGEEASAPVCATDELRQRQHKAPDTVSGLNKRTTNLPLATQLVMSATVKRPLHVESLSEYSVTTCNRAIEVCTRGQKKMQEQGHTTSF